MTTNPVDEFGPDHWLQFPNHFDEISVLWKNVGGWLPIPVGLSNLGMCGGVASAALDIFRERRVPPSQNTVPSSKNNPALFNWLKQRQVESVSLRDFWKYLRLMFTKEGEDKREILETWQQIKQDIQKGKPVLIGLERTKVETWYKVYQVVHIVKNHQVVVWKYKEEGGKVTLYLYDPNTPHLKDVSISFDQNAEKIAITGRYPRLMPVYTFFKANYTPKIPPPEIYV